MDDTTWKLYYDCSGTYKATAKIVVKGATRQDAIQKAMTLIDQGEIELNLEYDYEQDDSDIY